MKKILILFVCILGAFFANAQAGNSVQKMQEKEMDALEKRIQLNNKNLTFNKNQVARLERILFQKATDIVQLREKNVPKGDYIKEYRKIEDKYEPKVEAILTTEQRVEYRRNAKAQIQKKKD